MNSGVIVKALDCGIVVHQFELLLSDKYPWERYEPPDTPINGLSSTFTVLLKKRMDLALNTPRWLICH